MKNFMIFGDSYSTHKDFIPEGFLPFYCTGGRQPDKPITDMRPEQTWWGRILQNTDMKLVHNNSWSGSTIGYTGYEGDCSETSSFICRYKNLLKSGFFEATEVDAIFVFGGTNDSWADAPLGEEQYENWAKEDLFRVRPAICYFMSLLKQNHPEKRIIFIVNCDIKEEVAACIVNAGARLGVEVLRLHDIAKEDMHPTPQGMQQIYEQIVAFLD